MFANSWEERRRCFIPAQAIYLKDHRKQKEVKISRQDRTPMAIAGLWDIKREPALPDVFSFTLLTVSAENHPFFLPLWHEEDDQNARMPALLPDDWIDEWLDGSVEEGVSILERHADVFYVAVPAGKRSRNPPTAKIQRL